MDWCSEKRPFLATHASFLLMPSDSSSSARADWLQRQIRPLASVVTSSQSSAGRHVRQGEAGRRRLKIVLQHFNSVTVLYINLYTVYRTRHIPQMHIYFLSKSFSLQQLPRQSNIRKETLSQKKPFVIIDQQRCLKRNSVLILSRRNKRD